MEFLSENREDETLEGQETEFNFEQMMIFSESNPDDLDACDSSGSEGAGTT